MTFRILALHFLPAKHHSGVLLFFLGSTFCARSFLISSASTLLSVFDLPPVGHHTLIGIIL